MCIRDSSYSTLNNSTNVITYTVYPSGDIVVNSEFLSLIHIWFV